MPTEQQPEDAKSTTGERLALHQRRMKEAGFKRMSAWVSAELAEKLTAERRPGECSGRTLERLLLGKVAERPAFNHGSVEDAKQKLQRQVAQMVAGARARKA